MAQCKGMDFGEMKNNKNMLVTGRVIRLMAMEFIRLKRVIIKV